MNALQTTMLALRQRGPFFTTQDDAYHAASVAGLSEQIAYMALSVPVPAWHPWLSRCEDHPDGLLDLTGWVIDLGRDIPNVFPHV